MTSRNAVESVDSYLIAWIAALPIERVVAEAMLDEEHTTPTAFCRNERDENVYTWGRVGEHNVAIASLPSILVGLLVGIGGGIVRPEEGYDIRLGDTVVSQPRGSIGGVCQYDFIKAKPGDRREVKDFLRRPPTVLFNALTSIQANHGREYAKMTKGSRQSSGYVHQGFDSDRLFEASCDHVPGLGCHGCNSAYEVHRERREATHPEIHYGTILSRNTLAKDAVTCDQIVANFDEDCICFEMEAASLINHFPCLVIRGICDYHDSSKNDRWHPVEIQKTKTALPVLQLSKFFS
ncbi:nucleoside phosphorylase domain-containing protein [Aspergillus novoparasiticus]|uniref:Nucleoside phosphorylase domain-containing protein n=1 Tax=Aspergillus novoparasiticus TaxID=986946 RepID=A0A5N6F6D1_9EURO|nr:nucleoside phosphorylase domain-containing protein [Aspergillus novoparasiticus]